MTAKFKGEDTFIIRGRGLVLSGWIIEGSLRVGMALSIEGFPRTLTINGVEFIHTEPHIKGLIGLLFLSTDPQEITLWKELDVKDKIVSVVETEIPS